MAKMQYIRFEANFPVVLIHLKDIVSHFSDLIFPYAILDYLSAYGHVAPEFLPEMVGVIIENDDFNQINSFVSHDVVYRCIRQPGQPSYLNLHKLTFADLSEHSVAVCPSETVDEGRIRGFFDEVVLYLNRHVEDILERSERIEKGIAAIPKTLEYEDFGRSRMGEIGLEMAYTFDRRRRERKDLSVLHSEPLLLEHRETGEVHVVVFSCFRQADSPVILTKHDDVSRASNYINGGC